MKCKHIEIRIVEHVTEGISLETSEMEHVRSCKRCTQYLSEMQAIFTEELPEAAEPSSAYFESLWESVEPRLERQGNFLRFIQMPIVIQTIAAMLLIGVGFFGNQLFNSAETAKPNAADAELVRFMQQSQMALVSFANMDEYEQNDMLQMLTQTADTLLSTTLTLKEKYAEDEELSTVISNLERTLTMLSSMKDKSAATVRSFQYAMQDRRITDQIDQLSI